MVPIAHASDGGGSIRIPAACCGLVGLKCSRGRISMGPMVSDVMHGGVTEGCVSRTVADTAALYDTISGTDPTAWYNAPPFERPLLQEVGAPVGRLRIAYTTVAPTGVEVEPTCIAAVDRAAHLLSELGHDVFEGAPNWPPPEEAITPFLTVWNTGVALWPIEDWSKVEPLTAAMREQAERMNSIEYVRALASLQIYTRQIVASWGRDFDVLVTPTLAVEPPKVGALFEGAEQDPMLPLMKAAAMAAFTPLINATGQPAISLPLHATDVGLPVGVQLIGKPWGEAELIRLAAQLEQAFPWAQARPAIAACPQS
jgi:amidase